MKKRFLIPLAYGAALGLLIVSGLSCVNFIIHPANPIANWLPATESEFKSYIMPECPPVKEALQDILGDPPYTLSQAGFDDIRDWVATNIHYMSDEERWGKDYWQTPEQTLLYRTGDCEDFSILLCSLLRSYGIDAERVYVTLGVDGEEDGHAFLIENWYHDGEWRRIESQAPAQFSSWYSWFGLSNPDSSLDKYEITAAFNDLYCYDESFPWDTKQASISTMAKIATVVGDIAEQLSKLAEYLLGLLFK
ncbi:MAG: transglutaminase-like domain-containing protein [Dehalococcoidia bacterium]